LKMIAPAVFIILLIQSKKLFTLEAFILYRTSKCYEIQTYLLLRGYFKSW